LLPALCSQYFTFGSLEVEVFFIIIVRYWKTISAWFNFQHLSHYDMELINAAAAAAAGVAGARWWWWL